MSRASGLNPHDSNIARDRATQAALLGLHHAKELHYTQGPDRWEGIAKRLLARLGQFPTHADCSAFATWCLWNALSPFKTGDIVNGQHWQGGFTGTMAQHGIHILHPINTRRGDCVLYGAGPNFEHVAIVVTHDKNGMPLVVSNGSEGGPYFLPYNYRSDVGQIRRYI